MVVLVAFLIISLAWAEITSAGERPTTERIPPAESDPANTFFDESMATTIEKNIDDAHELLERNLLEQTIHLDSFLGNVSSESRRRTRYKLRWRNSLRVDQDGTMKLGSSVRGSLGLSRISERLRLTISGDDTPQPLAPSLPKDPGNPGLDRTTQTPRFFNTELRYEVIHTPSTYIFLGAGVRVTLPLEAFVRSRFQYTHRLSDVSLVRLGETLFANSLTGYGETTEVGLERSFTPKIVLRWGSTATASHKIQGVEWGTELSLAHEPPTRGAVTVTGGVYGNTSLNDVVSNYRLLARYRRNFLRSWLFYELEPEISWPRQDDGSFTTNFAVTLLLEIVFQGTEIEKEKKSAPP